MGTISQKLDNIINIKKRILTILKNKASDAGDYLSPSINQNFSEVINNTKLLSKEGIPQLVLQVWCNNNLQVSLPTYQCSDVSTYSLTKISTGKYRIIITFKHSKQNYKYLIPIVTGGNFIGNTSVTSCGVYASIRPEYDTSNVRLSYIILTSDDDAVNDGSFLFRLTRV